MKFPFSKIFRNNTKRIPTTVEEKLKESFHDAKNIEWEQKEDQFEAIFYLNDVENIAQFTK